MPQNYEELLQSLKLPNTLLKVPTKEVSPDPGSETPLGGEQPDGSGSEVPTPAAQVAPEPTAPPEEQEFFNLGEVLASPVRGAEEAVHGFYGLLDWAAFDSLPDWDEERLFGHAESTAGIAATGLMQFVVGSVGTGGILAGGAKLAGFAGKAIGGFKKVESGITAFKNAHGVTVGAKGVAAAAGKGAITDFTFFDAQEARLSDAVKGTFLENDVTRFLEQDEEDSELTARLKMSIEGLGIGAAFDGILLGMKKVWAVKRARRQAKADARDFTPHDAAKAYRDAEVAHADVGAFRDPETGEMTLRGPSPDQPIMTDRELPEGQQKLRDEVIKAHQEGRVAYLPPSGRHLEPKHTGLTSETKAAVDVALGNSAFGNAGGVGDWLEGALKAGDAQSTQDAIFRTTALRDGDEVQRIYLDLADQDMRDTIDATALAIRGYQHVSDDEAFDQVVAMSNHFMPDVMGFSGDEVLSMQSRVAGMFSLDKIRDVEKINRQMGVLNLTAMHIGHEAVDVVRRNLTDIKLAEAENAQLLDIIEDFRATDKAMESVYGIQNVQGRGLRYGRFFSASKASQKKGRKKYFQADQGDEIVTESSSLDNETIERLLMKSVGVSDITEARKVIINQLESVSAQMNRPGASKTEIMQAFMGHAKGTSRDTQFGKMTEYWLGNLLNGPKTHVANLASNFAVYAMRPVETAGSAVLTFGKEAVTLGGNSGRPFGHSWRLLQKTLDETFEVGAAFVDVVKFGDSGIRNAVKDAILTGEQRLTSGAHELGRRGDAAITPKSMKEGIVGRIARMAFGQEVGDAVSGGVGTVVGKQSRAAFHALAAGDELFKHLNYRMTMRSRLAREAREKGVDVGTHVSEGMLKSIRDGQALSRRTMREAAARDAETAVKTQTHKSSLHRARAHQQATTTNYNAMMKSNRSILHHTEQAAKDADLYTFQTRLDGDGFIDKAARGVSRVSQDIPIVRLFAPFITTPANILKFAGRRTALDPMATVLRNGMQVVSNKPLKALQESNHLSTSVLASGNQDAIDDLMGRWAMAGASTVLFGKLAYNGIENDDAGVGQNPHTFAITGRGPMNPDEKKAWLLAKNQEYSLTVAGVDIGLERLEPYGTLLGLVADAAQYAHFAPEDEDPGDIATAISMSVMHAFTSKTYLRGLQNLTTLMNSEDPGEVNKILKGITTSFQPGGAALKQLNDSGYDDHLREVRSMLDAFYARTPGLSEKLELRRDILGRPMTRVARGEPFGFFAKWTPFPVTFDENKDPVYLGLAQTGHGWKKPSTKLTINGVPIDLVDIKDKDGETAYSRYQQLTSEAKVGDRSAYERIEALMGTEWYQEQSALLELNPGDPLQDPRVLRIQSIIAQHRSIGANRLRREFPEILERVRSAHNKRAQTRGIFNK